MNELKLPEPDTHCLDDEGGRPIDVWSYSPDLVREIIAADRALREQAQPVPCPDNPAWHYERLDRLLSMTLSAESYEDYLYSLNIVAAPQAQLEQPRKERPDFIAGYMAGMADGKALRAQTERERAAKVCDDMKKAFVTAKFPTDYECSAAMNAAMKCATKIRELK